MFANPHRRGLLRGLIAVFGWGAAQAAAADPPPKAPPRCRHYYDGVLWSSVRPDENGFYRRNAEGCPYCRGDQAKRHACKPSSSVSVDSFSRVTSYVYDCQARCLGPKEPPPRPSA